MSDDHEKMWSEIENDPPPDSAMVAFDRLSERVDELGRAIDEVAGVTRKLDGALGEIDRRLLLVETAIGQIQRVWREIPERVVRAAGMFAALFKSEE